jgi:hypothetical protein
MQLFGLVNTLLGADVESSKRHLSIQQFSVTPLSPGAGLLGWVPHSDTLHTLIKSYRDSRKILVDIENRLMNQVSHPQVVLPRLHLIADRCRWPMTITTRFLSCTRSKCSSMHSTTRLDKICTESYGCAVETPKLGSKDGRRIREVWPSTLWPGTSLAWETGILLICSWIRLPGRSSTSIS